MKEYSNLDERQAYGEAYVRATDIVNMLELSGQFRFEGLTLGEWREAKALSGSELDAAIMSERK